VEAASGVAADRRGGGDGAPGERGLEGLRGGGVVERDPPRRRGVALLRRTPRRCRRSWRGSARRPRMRSTCRGVSARSAWSIIRRSSRFDGWRIALIAVSWRALWTTRYASTPYEITVTTANAATVRAQPFSLTVQRLEITASPSQSARLRRRRRGRARRPSARSRPASGGSRVPRATARQPRRGPPCRAGTPGGTRRTCDPRPGSAPAADSRSLRPSAPSPRACPAALPSCRASAR
jgi:hypothetical protein